jgi:F420H(2)-dependent quinone reductase
VGKILLFVVLIVVGFVAAIPIASELGGEVVSLKTNDAQGAQRTTSLWVVDSDGYAYLRSGNQDSGWYERLVADPSVEVERDGTSGRYTAEPAWDRTAEVDALMAEKYGWADTLIRPVRRNPIAIRLVPAE